MLREAIIEIKESSGLHARPAAELAVLAKKFKSSITLQFESKEANAKSVINLLTLGLKKGSVINLKVEGDDCEDAIREVIQFFKYIHP
ncbi:HPr family phosphocarrier protein [Proteiniphilum sp. UBA5384]|uniref:HPr family phosphocarrier protein n=1 Tax=Proteiniphilum sp. UBA5384 TaxID=1947279 RepID=UPI0032E3A0C3